MTALAASKADQEFAEAVCPWTGESGAAMWRLLIERDWIDYFERHRTPAGINAPRPYLLILGRRIGG